MPSTSKSHSASADMSRSSKRSLIVTLSISPNLLEQFEPKAATPKGSSQSKFSTSSVSTPAPVTTEESPIENGSETNGTPVPGSTPGGSTPTATDGVVKIKGIPGPKPGSKRGSGIMSDAPRAKGKPGPKKKPRLDDGTIDHGENAPAVKPNITASGALNHKLGPKANQGAINAGLRALDRSGKPCRKWEKKGFQIKSFTGVSWGVHTWRTPKPNLPEGQTGDSVNGSQALATDSEGKENKGSSVAVESEKSQGGGDVVVPATGNDLASSPVPAVATPA